MCFEQEIEWWNAFDIYIPEYMDYMPEVEKLRAHLQLFHENFVESWHDATFISQCDRGIKKSIAYAVMQSRGIEDN